MPYIGRAATNTGNVRYLDNIASGFDGSDTTFTAQVGGVSITPDQENVRIYLDGVFQHPGSGNAYTISGSTITFTEAPVANTVFSAYVVGAGSYLDDKAVSSAKLDDDAVTAAKLDDDGTGFQVGDLGVGGSLTSGDKLTVTGRARVSGGIIGDLTGDVTGDVTGNTSGTAATVTGAAQSNITSLGTLTTLTVDDITINGSTISDGGNLTLDVGGDIVLDADGGDIYFEDAGTTIGHFQNSSSDFVIKSSASDKDLLFKGNDGGSTITALSLDMSEGGNATFAGDIILDKTSDPSITLKRPNASTQINKILTDSAGLYFQSYGHATGGNNQIIFMTEDGDSASSPTERMRIESSGNVLINTTVPAVDLTATATLSTVNFASQRNDLVIDTYHAGGEMSALWFRKSDSNTVGTKTTTADARTIGAIYWQGVDTGGNFDYGAFIEAKQVDDAGARCPTEMRIGTSDGTNIPLRMKIDEVGNIGIRGIETPQAHASNWSMHLPDNYQIGFGDGANSRPDFGIVGDSDHLSIYCGEGSDDVDTKWDTNGNMFIQNGSLWVSNGIKTSVSSASKANGNYFDVFTVPNDPLKMILAHSTITGSDGPNNYNRVDLVFGANGNYKIVNLDDTNYMNAQMSGATYQVQQTSGATQTISTRWLIIA